jgi:aryl sulfotransferase
VAEPYRYVNDEEDSARWTGFPFRDGDIVISTRSKTGTTWVQMICALLVFQTPELPEPVARLSPWLDQVTRPREEVYARLEAQPHRRIIKTHTPLDGIALDPRARYIVTGRHPLDSAVSLYHQGNNIDREKLRALTGAPEPTEPPKPRKPLREWLVAYISKEPFRGDPRQDLDSLAGVMWHLSDAWTRRAEPNVLLVHYDELLADLEGQMRSIAGWLEIEVPEQIWPELVHAATFKEMKSNALQRVASGDGVLKSYDEFFKRGTSGAGREILTDDEIARYYARAAELAPPDLLSWLHNPLTAG